MIDLAPAHLETVQRILAKHVPGCEVRAFGSRVTWTAKDYSDLDLAVKGDKALPPSVLAALEEDFSESDLPIRVDVLDWHAISDSFRKVIEKKYEVVQKAAKRNWASCEPGLHLPDVPAPPSGWGWERLDSLSSVFDCPHSTPRLSLCGPIVARSQDIRTGFLRIDQAGRVTEKTYRERIARAEPCYGDLLFSREGTYFGIAAEVPPSTRVCLGQRMVLIRPRPEAVSFRYLRFWLNSPIMARHVDGFRDGSVAERLNMPTIRALPVLLPPLPIQRAIAHILGTLDDKIELNRQMNETLEAMARALFKSWFVDFDPVRAKAAGRDPGLPKEIAKLFPNAFVDSDLGEIPMGWKVGTLADLATLNPEAWTKETRPTIIDYVDLSNTKCGRIDAVTNYSQQVAPSRAQRVLRPRDTIIGTVRPGNCSYAFISEDGLTGSTGFAVLRPQRLEYAEFLYLAATGADNIDRLAHLADGAAYPAVRPEVVAATQAPRATEEVLERFSRIGDPIFARVARNENESRTLAAIRDTLLPKLMSGEMRVKDAEKFVGARV